MLPRFTENHRRGDVRLCRERRLELGRLRVAETCRRGRLRRLLVCSEALNLQVGTLIAQSVSGMDHPENGYIDGFTTEDPHNLLSALDANYLVEVFGLSLRHTACRKRP